MELLCMCRCVVFGRKRGRRGVQVPKGEEEEECEDDVLCLSKIKKLGGP